MFRVFFVLMVFVAGLLLPTCAHTQPSDCFSLNIGTVAGQPDEVVSVPVRVLGSASVLSMQFGIHWDPAQMTLESVDVAGGLPALGPPNFGTNVAGRLLFSWFIPSGQPLPLQTGDTLFKIRLRILPGVSGAQPVAFIAPSVFIVEVVDPTGEELPVQLSNGSVAVGIPLNNAPQITQICQTAATCLAPQGAITLETTGGVPPYLYSWEGPTGPLYGNAVLAASGGGEYGVTVTDQAGLSVSGSIVLESEINYVAIYPHTIQQPTCQGNDGKLVVLGQYGVPPYQFTWADSLSGNTSVADSLAPGVYALTITDQLGCTASAAFHLSKTTGFELDYTLTPPSCGQTNGLLTAVATGGAAPFRYRWSTGDTTASITCTGGVYGLTVTNAQGCPEEKPIFVETAGVNQSWVSTPQYDCDTLNGTADLAYIYWLAPGIQAPVTVQWSTGTVQWIDSVDAGGVFYGVLPDVPPGFHYAQVQDSAGCTDYLLFPASCAPSDTPNVASCLALQLGNVDAPSNVFCLPLRVHGAQNLKSLRFSLKWNRDYLRFQKITPVNLPGFDPLSLRVFQHQGALLFDWQDTTAAGLTLPDGSVLIELCFAPLLTTLPASPIIFSDLFAPQAIDANGQALSFAAFDGGVNISTAPLNSVCALAPDCTNDGKGGFLIDHPALPPNSPALLYQHGNLQWEGDLMGLSRLQAGAYRAQLGQVSPLGALLHIPLSILDDCVWPGDADQNRASNHHDLLYIGLAHGATGSARAAGSIEWIGQDGASWQQYTPLRRIDYKNADTDGNGVVSANDTLAIAQNWGLVVDAAVDNPYDAPGLNASLPVAPLLHILPDTVHEGDQIALPVVLGSIDLPVNGLHGLAFSVTYDTTTVHPGLYFVPASSWLGDPASELYCMQRNFPSQHRLDVALTRFDGLAASGEGVIGHLFIVIEDEIFAHGDPQEESGSPADSFCISTLRPGSIRALQPDERPVALRAEPTAIVISGQQSSSTTAPAHPVKYIHVRPNPTSSGWTLTAERGNILRVELYDAGGQLHLSRHGLQTSSLHLPAESLAEGWYFVKITSTQGVFTEKLAILRP